jgi:hypothetical protein
MSHGHTAASAKWLDWAETICRIPGRLGCDTVRYSTGTSFYVGGSDHSWKPQDQDNRSRRIGRHERCNAAAVQPRLRVQTPGLPLHANLSSDSELRVPECLVPWRRENGFVCISSSSDRFRHVCIRTHLILALRGFKPPDVMCERPSQRVQNRARDGRHFRQ